MVFFHIPYGDTKGLQLSLFTYAAALPKTCKLTLMCDGDGVSLQSYF